MNSMLHFGDRAQLGASPTRQPLQAWATDFEVAAETWRHYVEFALTFCAQQPRLVTHDRQE